jgi:hypothetical protein
MRTLSPQEAAALDSAGGYQARLRVLIKGPGGAWQDMTTLGGFDWVRGVTRDRSVDQPVAQVTVRLAKRQSSGISLAPLLASSKLNLVGAAVDLSRELKVDMAILPLGINPSPTDWKTFFHGYVGPTEQSGAALEITARDLGWKLQRTFIETERFYGAAGGTDVRTIMQSILTDNGTGVTLYTPVDPTWPVKTYKQTKMSVMEALQVLAKQRGWEIGYKWRESTSQFELTFDEPLRTKSIPDYTMKPSRYLTVDQLTLDADDVRNAIHGVCYDRDTLDSSGNASRVEYSASDATSIAKHGRVWCEFAFGTTSQIDSTAELQHMVDAALADMKDPTAVQQVTMHIFPHLDLGDLIRWKANGEHYDTDQDWAITTLRDTWAAPDDSGAFTARTSVGVRGKPSGNRQLWLELMAAPGVAIQQPMVGPDAPTGVTATAVQGGIAVKFTPPASGGWDTFELHVSTTSGFTPGSATFKKLGSEDRIEIGDLVPGQTYYAKVVPRDAFGNTGTASSQVTVAAGYTSLQAIQPRATVSSVVANPDFEIATVAGAPPDCWTFDSSASGGQSWGTGVGEITTDSASGGQAVRLKCGLNGVSPAVLNSRYFVVNGGGTIKCSYVGKLSATTGGSEMAASIVWFDASFVPLGNNNISTINSSLSTWASYTLEGPTLIVAPSNARYAQIQLIAYQASASAGIWAYFDSIQVDVLPNVSAHYYRSSAFSTAIPDATWEAMDFDTKEVDTHNAVTTSTATNKWTPTFGAAGNGWRFVAPLTGTYQCSASVGFTAMNVPSSGREMIIEWIINSGAYMRRGTRMAVGASNNQGVHCSTSIQLNAGDVLQLRVYQASGGAKNVEALREANWITIDRIDG